jgi:hypothetical protein
MWKISLALPLFFLGILAIAPPTVAQADSGVVEVHGYGSWAYGRSDGNRYLGSTEDGSAKYVSLAVALASQASDRVWISTQVWWEADASEEGTATIDYAFGEWRLSDALRLRLGKVKQPYGIYTEVFDVGTIRPFFWLPQGIYGPSGTVAEAYKGIGFTGSVFAAGGWRFEYDLYGGEIGLEAPELADLFASEADSFAVADAGPETEGDLRDLAGGRLTVTIPGPEIRLGLSAYAGHEEGARNERHSCLGAHAEYLSDDWSLRSEFTHLRESRSLDADAAYLEIARRLGSVWQLAGRLEGSRTRLDRIDTRAASSLLHHRDITFGLNYWFHPDFVAKLSTSQVYGNRFSRPEDLREALEGDGPRRRTRVVSLGVQFAF